MEVEAKLLDRMAKEELDKAPIQRDERNTYVFTLAFKYAYRRWSGHTLKYMCKTKCFSENCTCKLPNQ